LTVQYSVLDGEVSAVDHVTFSVDEGEALGLAGESGSGKTSIAFGLMKLLPENARLRSGPIRLRGTDLAPLSEEAIRPYRLRRIAMVSQAAMNSLDPIFRVGDQIVEALQIHNRDLNRAAARTRVAELFERLDLDPALASRFPHQLSGGMRQRAAIAMALSCTPEILIADEPTTALDTIVQDSILSALRELQERDKVGMIHISHDIAVLAEVCRRIAILYAGRIVEIAGTKDLFFHPRHPYTRALLTAFPSILGPKRPLRSIPGEPPDPLHPPPGCRFHPRCPQALDICRREVPPDRDYDNGHLAACFNPVEWTS
jgi:peptide/nickel transport system ATP-binding protein